MMGYAYITISNYYNASWLASQNLTFCGGLNVWGGAQPDNPRLIPKSTILKLNNNNNNNIINNNNNRNNN